MTRELLEDYPHICAEIQDLEREMRELVSDSVSGSGLNFPYTQHTVSIRGVPPDLVALKARKEAEKAEIERFIQGLPNSKLRRIVRYRVIHEMSWEQIAAKMGHRASADAIKHRYYRIFEEI